MALRAARTNDIWRALYKGDKRPVHSVAITYKDTPDGPDISVTLNAPISLLCGENGVGKSRALRAFHQAIGGRLNGADFRPKAGPPIQSVSSVHASLRHVLEDNKVGEPYEIAEISALADALTDGVGACNIFYFDPTVQVPYLLHLLRHDQSLSDLWDGVDAKKLNESERQEVSALIGRTYSEIEYYEISDYQDHEVVPYFRVTCNGESYGAEEMGLGELSLFFFYWMLGRVGFGAVFLMEEPETFVAPKSQRALIDLVATRANENKLFVAVTSHSGVIAERIPNSHTDFVSRHGKVVTFLRNPPRNILVDRLSLIAPRSLVVLVEDNAAALYARALLEAGNSKYISQCGIYVAGGESEISGILEKVKPTNPVAVSLIGLYDGDQKGKLPEDLPWPSMHLPGGEHPEAVVGRFLMENRTNLSEILNKPQDRIVTALSAVDGQNHHDWLIGFLNLLQISMEELFRCVASNYLKTSPQVISDFIGEFESKARLH